MRILIATDAWHPQINGVVRTLENVTRWLNENGHMVSLMTGDGCRSMPMPFYPEIRLAHVSQARFAGRIETFKPHAIHIATEGPVGIAARKWCVRNRFPFTTSYHTQFPQYLSMRIPIPGISALSYRFLRWFHRPSQAVLTPTQSITDELAGHGFENLVTWTRGVDRGAFPGRIEGVPRRGPSPVMISTGRIAVEKRLEDFLRLDVPGTKVVIGDGPARKKLEAAYPDAIFTGYLNGEDLAREMSAGDVFVFPSRSDTFGLVILEAMACGLPVAAYPVAGPIDVVDHGVSGWLDDDLGIAVRKALELDSAGPLAQAERYTWAVCADQFLHSLVPAEALEPPVPQIAE